MKEFKVLVDGVVCYAAWVDESRPTVAKVLVDGEIKTLLDDEFEIIAQ